MHSCPINGQKQFLEFCFVQNLLMNLFTAFLRSQTTTDCHFHSERNRLPQIIAFYIKCARNNQGVVFLIINYKVFSRSVD